MRKFIMGCVFLTILGCATWEESDPKTAPSPTASIDFQKTPAPADKKLTGRNYFIYDASAGKTLSTGAVARLETKLRAHLNGLGFIEVKSSRRAHLVVTLYSDHVSDIADKFLKMMPQGSSGASVVTGSTHTVRFVNGKKVYEGTEPLKSARFILLFDVNEFGKRSVRVSSIVAKSPIQEWTGYEDQLVTRVDQEFTGLIGAAPATDLKMKGEPGCTPRFGYENEGEKVVKVFKGSAAEASGIKVGDLILGIDSEPVTAQDPLTDVYEKRIPVPLKLKRGDQIVRTQIQAKLMCE